MTARRLAIGGLALGLCGCPRTTTTVDPPTTAAAATTLDGGAATDDAVASETDAGETDGAAAFVPCGEVDARWKDLKFLPPTIRVAILLDVANVDADAARERFANHARGEGHGLPIELAFSVGQWSWQVPALRASLRSVGLAPAHLLYVRTEKDPSGAWLLPHACDLDELKARTTEAWGLSWRTRVEGALGSAPTGFAWDVLALPGDRIAFVPAGGGGAWTEALQPDPGRPSPGKEIDVLPDAPIRGFVTGQAFVDPRATTIPSDQVVLATATSVYVGDRLPDDP